MKYLIIILCLITSSSIAQTHQQEIAKHRENYKADFIKETHSPLKETDLKDLHFFEADSTYKITANVEILTNQKIFKMPTYDGTSKEFIRYAKLSFKLNGKQLQLTLYKNIGLMANPIYKDLLFLPFTDESNGKTTYGGGRYIDLDSKNMVNNILIFDFNKAYNPYCAYSDGYRCPVPPEENDLTIKINSGEKLYTGKKKHKQ